VHLMPVTHGPPEGMSLDMKRRTASRYKPEENVAKLWQAM
jgi:hypothetical protein